MKTLITRLGTGVLLIVCLSSCTVVKDPISYSYVDINTGVRAGRDVDYRVEVPGNPKATADNLSRIKGALGDDEVVTAAPVAASGPKVEVCAKYVSPNLAPLPRLTEAQMTELAKLPPDRFSEALLVHMKSMYRYSKAVQAANAEALKKHLSTCRQAVVQ